MAWALAMVSSSSVAAAATVLVTIRVLDTTDPAPYELRLRSELASEGIDAIVANASSVGEDAKQIASRFGANAVIEIVVSANELATSIWAADPSLSLEVTRNLRVSNQQRDAVAIFALRTVDFLRGARLELEQQRRTKLAAASSSNTTSVGAAVAPSSNATPPPVATPKTKIEPTGKPRPALTIASASPDASRSAAKAPQLAKELGGDRFRVNLGYALLLSSDRFGWSTAPTLSVAWESSSHWGAALSFSGPFLNRIASGSGSYDIAIDQEFLQVEMRGNWEFARDWAIEPLLAIGGSRYAADGSGARPPLVGGLAKAWSLYSGAGASLLWRTGKHLHWFGEIAGFVRWEAPHVLIENENRTGSSRWNLLAKLGPGWYF